MNVMETLIRGFEKAGLILKEAIRPFGSNKDVFGMDIKRGFAGTIRKEWFEIWLGHETNRVEVLHTDADLGQLVLLVKEEKRKFTETIQKTKWNTRIPPQVKILKETKNSWVIERSTPGSARRFLVGVDERQLFMCQLRGSVHTVRDAHDSLKSPTVKTAEGNLGRVIRQGEWFFLPLTPDENERVNVALKKSDTMLLHKVRIARTASEAMSKTTGGKPHTADDILFLKEEKLVHGFPLREGAVFVRGNVKHADHATVKFADWKKVMRNMEQAPIRGSIAGGSWID